MEPQARARHQEPSAMSGAGTSAHAISRPAQGPSRRRPPDRRTGYTVSVVVGGTEVKLSTGEYEDGTLAEIDLNSHKEGAAFRELLKCFAKAVSMGLQHGVPLQDFCQAFLRSSFEPSGMVQGSESIASSSSVIDFVFQELALSNLKGRGGVQAHSGLPAPGLAIGSSPDVPSPHHARRERGIKPVLASAVETSQDAAEPTTANAAAVTPPQPRPERKRIARHLGFTGDPCAICGHITLIRNGACLLCKTCGASTGCG